MYRCKRDFTHNIPGLIDASMEALWRGGPNYIGSFRGFTVLEYHMSLLLANPEWRAADTIALSRYLENNGWQSLGGVGIIILDEGTPDQIDVPYINVNRVTKNREKLHEEMKELSRILQHYTPTQIRR